MKSLIVYDTRHGTSRAVAERIAAAMEAAGGEADLLDLSARGAAAKGGAAAGSLSGYDAVAIGAPFYMGQWSRRAAAFAKAREAELAGKRLGLFALGSDAELGVEAAKAALPASLAGALAAAAYIGGSIRVAGLGRFERFIVKMVSGKAEDSSNLDLAAADSFASRLAGGVE